MTDLIKLKKEAKSLELAGKYSEAFELYLQAAKNGDTDCEAYVGYCYLWGVHTPQKIDLGIEWLTRSIKKGHEPSAQELLLYFKSAAPHKIESLLLPFVKNEKPWALFELGHEIFHAQSRYKEGIELLEKAAHHNDFKAARQLTWWYDPQNGYPIANLSKKNYWENKYTELLKKAANSEDVEALEILSEDLIDKKEFTLALQYSELGHKKGSPLCTIALARLYQNGWGIDKNLKQATELYSHIQSENHKIEADFFKTHPQSSKKDFMNWLETNANFMKN